jgi:hypothetical protein
MSISAHSFSSPARTIAGMVVLAISLITHARAAESWKEEALQHDGSKIVVERTMERRGRHEVGQAPPIAAQSLAFVLPGTQQNVTWEDPFTPEIGSASFLLMLLETWKGAAYLVANPMGCVAYNKWGRPNPPYVVFKYQNREWSRVPLRELPVEIKTPNLLISEPDVQAMNSGQPTVSAETIKALNAGYRRPEYSAILRTEIANPGGSRCGEMISNGKGRWIGIGWFRRQASYEACTNYCSANEVGAENCPCLRLFKGK